jgi:hypothetical protein
VKKTILIQTALTSLTISAHADNYAIAWGTAPDGRTPLYLDGNGGLTSPDADAFVNNGWYYAGYLRWDGQPGELVATNRDGSTYRYWIKDGRFELEPPPPPPQYNLSNVKNLVKVGTHLSDLGKPGGGVVVKSNANGVSIKWKKDKTFWWESSTQVLPYSYQELVTYLNNGGLKLQ